MNRKPFMILSINSWFCLEIVLGVHDKFILMSKILLKWCFERLSLYTQMVSLKQLKHRLGKRN